MGRSLSGAEDAFEKTKHAGSELARDARSRAEETYGEAAGRARRAYGAASDAVQERTEQASDLFSEVFRATEEHVHRRPMQALFAAAAIGFIIGHFRR